MDLVLASPMFSTGELVCRSRNPLSIVTTSDGGGSSQ